MTMMTALHSKCLEGAIPRHSRNVLEICPSEYIT